MNDSEVRQFGCNKRMKCKEVGDASDRIRLRIMWREIGDGSQRTKMMLREIGGSFSTAGAVCTINYSTGLEPASVASLPPAQHTNSPPLSSLGKEFKS